MSYIALYRQWRPAVFEDVVGQHHITDTLQQAIETDKVAHAYLFSGPRGTGKTSTAKIFAKALNCNNGPTAHPCNVCDVCRHITNGESLDVVEIDAASNRSIEDIRSLRETVKFMPAEGRKKIYIVDEVHMLTTEAFNALLKTLEEPPAHVVFILATTEPEKIPMTILSRCQRYEFRRITSDDIAQRLLYIAGESNIDLTVGAAHVLAVQADGGLRDALSMLDQCISTNSGKIDEVVARDLLGLIGRDWLLKVSAAIFESRGDEIIAAVDEIVRMGKEPRQLLLEVLTHLRAIMLYQAAPESDTLAPYADSLIVLKKQAEQVSALRIFAIMDVLQKALNTAKTSPVPRIAVEVGLLMASRTVATDTVEGILERLRHLENQSTLTSRAEIKSITSPEPAMYPRKTPPIGVAGTRDNGPGQSVRQTVSPSGSIGGTVVALAAAMPGVSVVNKKDVSDQPKSPAAMPELVPPKNTVPGISGNISLDPKLYGNLWNKVITDIKGKGKHVVASCMMQGKLAYVDDGQAVVVFKASFMAERASKVDYRQYVEVALEQLVGCAIHMEALLEDSPKLAKIIKKKTDKPKAILVLEQADLSVLPKTGKLRQISVDEIPKEERVKPAIKLLLETFRDCTIYVEE